MVLTPSTDFSSNLSIISVGWTLVQFNANENSAPTAALLLLELLKPNQTRSFTVNFSFLQPRSCRMIAAKMCKNTFSVKISEIEPSIADIMIDCCCCCCFHCRVHRIHSSQFVRMQATTLPAWQFVARIAGITS